MAKEDLKPFNTLTEEEQKELARKGGIASGEARRRKRLLKDELIALLETNDNQEKMSIALIEKAISGDVQAFNTIRDTIGEKPVDRVEQETVTKIKVDVTDE